jgi:hypothetical protein
VSWMLVHFDTVVRVRVGYSRPAFGRFV